MKLTFKESVKIRQPKEDVICHEVHEIPKGSVWDVMKIENEGTEDAIYYLRFGGCTLKIKLSILQALSVTYRDITENPRPRGCYKCGICDGDTDIRYTCETCGIILCYDHRKTISISETEDYEFCPNCYEEIERYEDAMYDAEDEFKRKIDRMKKKNHIDEEEDARFSSETLGDEPL